MPQIGQDLWRVALSFFWYREYQDGRIEQEFDLETGAIRPWGSETPEDLKMVGWLPVSTDLAQKMRASGEFGIPTQAPAVLLPVNPGEEPVIFKDCTVWDGKGVHCKACGGFFRATQDPDVCPICGAKVAWRCPTCHKLDEVPDCPACKIPGQVVNPLESRPLKWEEVEYFLGIKGKFVNRFNNTRLITEH